MRADSLISEFETITTEYSQAFQIAGKEQCNFSFVALFKYKGTNQLHTNHNGNRGILMS